MELAALEKQLRTLQTESIAKIGAAETSAALDDLGSSLLGKRGALTDLLRGIGALSAEDRPKIGAIANEVRAAIDAALSDRRGAAGAAELSALIAAESADPTAPGPLPQLGSLHPIPETIGAIARIMASFGLPLLKGKRLRMTSQTSSCSTSLRTTRRAISGTRSIFVSRVGSFARTHRQGRFERCAPCSHRFA